MSNYKKILEYRSHLMGLAILWVVFYHMPINITNPALRFVWETGYGGVDIFFFLSGIGVYYSLQKNTTEVFYRRRLKRIMPAYLPIVTITFVLYNWQNWQGLSFAVLVDMVKQLAGNIFMVGWFNHVNGQFNWYVQAVMWFYLVAPLLLSTIRKVAFDKKKILCFWAVVFFMQVPFFDTDIHKMPARLLIFILGIWVAKYFEEDACDRVMPALKYIALLCGVAILALTYYVVPDWLSMYGLYWYPFVLIVPGVCVLFTRVFEGMKGNRALNAISGCLACIGKASFEVYLIHILLFEYILKPIGVQGGISWTLGALGAIVMGCGYQTFIHRMRGEKHDKFRT